MSLTPDADIDDARPILCAICETLCKRQDQARKRGDFSAEVDARVLYRRHMLNAHGQRLPSAI
ncbi:hypothetical protein AB0C52_17770 [Streptomyces sp. NPDC048717]|uniref:hypothetical protein n=1 Tax=Streptomyces sp. NPDC048717 TaxID=3154928 RepID=UPI00341AABE4